MDANQWVCERYMRALARSPRGRAWLLDFLAAAEVDEDGVFEELLARVDDAELRKMVRKHRDDETRHYALIRECVARQRETPIAVLPEHRLSTHVDRALGGFWSSFRAERSGVMDAYVLLQVLEELSVSIYPLVVEALRPVDPESARVIEGVLRDEERHVMYARAISRRYAPDDVTLGRTVQRMRAIEQRCSRECNLVTLRYAVENDLLETTRMEGMFWKAAARVA
jgi:rubrerythrin